MCAVELPFSAKMFGPAGRNQRRAHAPRSRLQAEGKASKGSKGKGQKMKAQKGGAVDDDRDELTKTMDMDL